MRSTKSLSWIRKLLGLEPMPVPPYVFAVDERQLRLARFDHSNGSYELTTYSVVELDHDLFASGPLGGPIHDPERFRSAIADLQSSISDEVTEGSLILPDPWLRLAFVDGEELPRQGGSREEVLRWKLQRIVPFRVEELRVRGVTSQVGSRHDSLSRVLLGFGLESLLRQLEGAFEDRGIHLGYLSSESLTLLSAVQDALRDVELGAVVFVSSRGYSLTFVLRGEPVLHRFKALPQLTGDEPPEPLIDRDLKLTEGYLRDQFPGAVIGRLLLIGPQEFEERWLGWLSEGFDLPAHAVRSEHLPLTAAGPEMPLYDLVAMLGAARQDVR